jgi:hypothetical protein
VNVQQFAPDTRLKVRVWNAGQLAALERNARCAVVSDTATGAERITCPDSLEYRRVVPEEHTIPLRSRVEVASKVIAAGERFRIRLSGTSRDNCNTTSAEFVGVATSGRMVLDGLPWESTVKACL